MRGSCARLVGSSVDSVGADDGFDAAVVVDALGSCDMSAALAAGASLAGGSFVDRGFAVGSTAGCINPGLAVGSVAALAIWGCF